MNPHLRLLKWEIKRRKEQLCLRFYLLGSLELKIKLEKLTTYIFSSPEHEKRFCQANPLIIGYPFLIFNPILEEIVK